MQAYMSIYEYIHVYIYIIYKYISIYHIILYYINTYNTYYLDNILPHYAMLPKPLPTTLPTTIVMYASPAVFNYGCLNKYRSGVFT